MIEEITLEQRKRDDQEHHVSIILQLESDCTPLESVFHVAADSDESSQPSDRGYLKTRQDVASGEESFIGEPSCLFGAVLLQNTKCY